MAETKRGELTYARFAAVALPPLLLAVVCLVYRDLDRFAKGEEVAESARTMQGSASAVIQAPPPPVPAGSASVVFAAIYDQQVWGKNAEGEGTSGEGSTLESTAPYRTFLADFLKKYDIKSVVDAGCGDWEFSQAIDWRGIDYKGYDIVPAVIAKNKAKYEKPNINFFVANIVDDELPPADLLVSKHVLQHLSNADVAKFFRQLPKYKHVLLTNGVGPRSLSSDNHDIVTGHFRYLDPTKPPFSLPGAKLLTWWDGGFMHQIVHLARQH